MFVVPTPHYLSNHLPGMEPFFFSPLQTCYFSFSLTHTHKDIAAAHRQGYRVNQPFIWEMVGWAPIILDLCAAKKTSVSPNIIIGY